VRPGSSARISSYSQYVRRQFVSAAWAVLCGADVQPVCSPTRATIMTGRHVIHTGVYDPMNGGSGDLSLNFTLLPQHLQALGYTCHMVGKVRSWLSVS
jgi:hypothetical protein